MKKRKTILIILVIALSFCFGYFLKEIISEQSKNSITLEQKDDNTKMNKVTGIGGIFFKCKDPDKLREWYKIHLGFDTNQFGTRFEWQEGTNPTRRGSIQWSPFPETTNYFHPSTKDFMINYRVDNLDKLVEQLKKEDVTFIDTIVTFDYGKFVHIMDIEGNKIELYEPNFEYGTTD